MRASRLLGAPFVSRSPIFAGCLALLFAVVLPSPGFAQKKPGEVEFSPPIDLAWPLAVGRWGVTRGNVRVNGRYIAGESLTMTWTVDSFEDVLDGLLPLVRLKG